MTQSLEFLFGYTNMVVNGVIILFIFLNFVVHKFRQVQEEQLTEQKTRLLSLSTQTRELCCRFSLDQMQRATSSFHDDLVIGEGGFGKVYKGTLALGQSTVVAIKRLDSTSSQGSTEFRAEIEMLSKVRHSHIVSLTGYCDEGREMILVYEFMPGGTLADHLYKRVRKGDKSVPPLSWIQRLKICIGAARGLDYLHTGTGTQHRIIHRDVKTTNILLDEKFAAKISDFGLSKIGPANQADSFVSTRVKGTPGYCDPYYFDTQRLTRKSDVYAFGVVLFEVLCGRPAVDKSLNQEQRGLARWAQHCYREGLLGHIIDPKIKEVCPDCLETFVKVAIQCLHTNPKCRPNMAEVVVALESALLLQEKSSDYILPEIITSDDNEDDSHQQNRSSTIMKFGKRLSVFLARAARGLSANRDEKPEIFGTEPIKTPSSKWKTYKYNDLSVSTRNFHPDSLLEQGEKSSVYKGWVDENTFAAAKWGTGLPTAIKKFNHEVTNAFELFLTEINIQENFCHPNIVKLIGFCSAKRGRLLVYEFMCQGSLHTHLFRSHGGTGFQPLSWRLRISIALGAAKGLAYLHSGQEIYVIHRDIKPSHILIDSDYNAKLSGFGAAKLGRAHESTDVTTIVQGTLGYLDPEYFHTGHVTMKSDVYSFGVVLLVILTGRQAIVMESPTEEECHIVTWAGSRFNKEHGISDIMDADIKGQYTERAALKACSLALKCVSRETEARPDAKQVVEELEQLLDLVNSESISNQHRTTYEYNDLSVSTRNFHPDSLLAQGGYSCVYKGWVDENTFAAAKWGTGLPTAIKKFNHGVTNAYELCLTEIDIQENFCHPNIVKLIGYCLAKRSPLLVYEFMCQGSLHTHLFRSHGGTEFQPLSWRLRISIALGAAKGLAHLHSGEEIYVIHRDIKPSHILIDSDYNAKLSGFGAAKLGRAHESTDVTTKVQGTIGYLDPEYWATGHVTMKSDVYGFGVVLLVILTGRQPVDMKSPTEEERHIITWATSRFNKEQDISDIMDADIKGQYTERAALKAYFLALECISRGTEARPDAEQVVEELEQLLDLVDSEMFDIEPMETPSSKLKTYKYNDLSVSTWHFHPDSLLKQGFRNCVYMGWVDENTFAAAKWGTGLPTAIKKFNHKATNAYELCLTEIDIQENFCHPNIVKLIGYCLAKRSPLLVYEFMCQGNLDMHLFRSHGGTEFQPLSWRLRISIALGAAKGLAHLHSGEEIYVIHRDIKPSHILIDSDYNAKLSGFGAAKLGRARESTHVTTVVQGTLGYLDPDYVDTGHVTMKSDVYGFGVVLLVILTGRQAFDMKYQTEERHLVTWARSRFNKEHGISDIMDADIKGQYTERAALKASSLALKCVSRETEARPDAKQVVEELEQLLDLVNSESISNQHRTTYEYNDLSVSTRNFHPDSLLAQGGYSCVYKGWVDENTFAAAKWGTGLPTAIKKFNHGVTNAYELCLTEIDIQENFCHPNIVKLIGYCLAKRSPLLVYEFMCQGSLHTHLFRSHGGTEFQPLSWRLRISIALGAAKGLAHLHSGEEIYVIHRDIKPSHILIDSDYNAKLSGFGAAKLGRAHESTDVTTKVQGTIGYLDPEYWATGHVTMKSDVYGFGVVLLVILTGRQPVDMKSPTEEERHIITWARSRFNKEHGISDIMDADIKGQYTERAALKASSLALKCVSRETEARPDAKQVVEELEQLLDLVNSESSSNQHRTT